MPDETTALRALLVEAQNLVAHAHAQGMSVTIQPTTNGKPLVRFSRSPMHQPHIRPSSDQRAAVATTLHWIPITDCLSTPFGSKCLLIRKAAGQAHIGTLRHGERFYDHWYPLPTFMKEANHVRETSNAGGTDHPPVDSAQA